MEQKKIKRHIFDAIGGRKFLLPFIVPMILFIVLSLAIFLIARDQLISTGNMIVDKFYSQANSVLKEMVIANNSLLINNTFTQELSDTYSKESSSHITQIIDRQLSQCMCISNIYVMVPEHGKVYERRTEFGYNSAYSLLKGENIILGTEDMDEILSSFEEGLSVPLNPYGAPYYVSFVYDEYGNKKATILSVINKSYLFRTLISSDAEFCCMYNNNFAITSLLKNYPDLDYESNEAISDIVGARVQLFTIKNNNYTYLAAIKRSRFYRPLFLTIIAFSAYFGVLILFNILHMLSIAKYNRELYGGIMNELPKPDDNPEDSQWISVQNVFTSIHNALENYKKEQQNFSQQARFRNLEKFVRGHSDQFTDKKAVESMNLVYDAQAYYVARFYITNSGILDEEYRNDITCIILENTMNGFSHDTFRSVFLAISEDNYCGIINVLKRDVTVDFISESIRHMSILLEKDYGTTFRCILSDPVSDITAIPSAYTEVLNIFRFVRMLNSTADIVTVAQLKETPDILLKGDFLKQLQIFSNALILGKYEIVPDMVDSILNEHVAPLRKDYAQAILRLQAVTSMLIEAPLPEKMSSEDVDSIRDKIKTSDSISALKEAVHNGFDNIKMMKEDDAPVKRATEYIRDHISDVSLGVPQVAEASGISIPHLSRLFKAQLHVTMVEYINHYRVEKAKGLLSDTSLNIALIAEQTGYSNTVTFTRNFRKYVGCSPSEYRNNVR